ncbi:MAG: ABC transporter permease [Chloroflexi bacterium]|nr:MAG: ABC transporter permease [Chloroflexota bacterium]TMF70824.1 MAG: ABC transporter permease [Chloroflexota bacterium]TMF79910.1 MAG: ABC transporter permease [Chloroflexota bacterium]TMF93228.1 MAG: ABC transporter permease [Chloroflexota bacterium]TMG42689.1 MAG: ABC transporter permease [Chloroflexota bacterium]
MSRGTLVYAAQRLVLITVTAVVVSSIVFIGIHQLPGNALASERRNNPATEAALLHHYNLDLPWPQQYVLWVQGLAHGDMGESLVNMGVQITPLLLREARVSVTLGLAAVLITIGVGLTLGTIAAIRQNTWVDYVASTSAVVGYSVPSFVWAFLLILLTVSGFYAWTGGLVYENIGWGKIEQIPVPALALGLPYAAIVARLTRASMLEVIRQDYVRTAWAKGLKARVVILRHSLRNALIPVISILGPLVTGIITGSVVIEYIFGIPGLGQEFVSSILSRDYNIVIGVFTFYAVLIGLANLAVDLIYPVLDPRIRY